MKNHELIAKVGGVEPDFKVGDLVVRRFGGSAEIYRYASYSEKHDLHFFESTYNYGHITLDKVRHATQSEIAAGHRIEPNTDDVADIGYHVSPSCKVVNHE